MQFKPMMVMALASLVLVPAAFADSGKGKSGSAGGGAQGSANGGVRLIAKMTPTPGSIQDSLFEGHAVRRTQGTARAEFEARAEVPVGLLGGNPNDVPQTQTLVLSTGTTCRMVLDQVDALTDVAQYKTSIRSQNGVSVDRAGSCNPAGIPNVSDVDQASVDINGNMLSGPFVTKR